MKKALFALLILFVFSVSAYAHMDMMESQQGQKGDGMTGDAQCMHMMRQMTGQSGMMESMMQTMMDMMNMQEKMMMGPKADEKKQMMKDMSGMKEKMQNMMSMHMGIMMRHDLKCAEQWLKKAIDLHEIHIKDPKTATEASQMEMMEQMKNAYECITTGLETTETPAAVREGEKTKNEDSPETEQHKHSH
jgi:hypothetical protein